MELNKNCHDQLNGINYLDLEEGYISMISIHLAFFQSNFLSSFTHENIIIDACRAGLRIYLHFYTQITVW